MKTNILIALAVCGLSVRGAPRLDNYSFTQDEQSGIVTISFDLRESSVLTLDVLTNGVSIGWRNFRGGFSGADIGKVNPAGSYSLVWRPMSTWKTASVGKIAPGGIAVEVKAWSTNNTPDYMDIDLSSQSNVTWYVSEEDLPYDVTNDVYKTTHMLMKRVHAANRVWRMGSPSTEVGRPKADAKERAHLVSLSADYYMSVFETTQGQWKNMGAGAIASVALTNDVCPLTGKTYPQIRGYSSDCRWPSVNHVVGQSSAARKFADKTGVRVDLPTEAQWEYACRAGVAEAYQNGSNSLSSASSSVLSEFAVWSGNAPVVVSDDLSTTTAVFAAVGTRKPNAWGFYDMIGNVSEMCVEWRSPEYPSDSYVLDPLGTNRTYSGTWNSGSLLMRGSTYEQGLYKWDDSAGVNYYCHRSAYRGTVWGDIKNSSSASGGFRFVAPVGDWPPIAFESNTAVQDMASRTVNITYDLSEDAIVTLSVYTNGVKVSDEALRSVSGDVNRLVGAGEGRRISWYPDESWPWQEVGAGAITFSLDKYSPSDPPAYMALDLTHSTMTNVFWYASAEAMPEPITNDVWKTDFLVMRRIPAKDVVWEMGVATNAQGEAYENVGYDASWCRRHRVKFSQDYYISVFELTRRQGRVFDDAYSGAAYAETWTQPLNGSQVLLRTRGDSYNWPHTGHAVSDGSAINKFRTRFGLQFDLPTEAQWEYACRAGTASAFCGGTTSGMNGNNETYLADYGWYNGNSGEEKHPVGTKKPNNWGIYDMHGNVAEYCLDAYDSSMGLSDEQFLSKTPVVDPFGAYQDVVSGTTRVCRGGSCKTEYWYCRSSDRYISNHPDASREDFGYRLVCPLPGEVFSEPEIP